MHKKRSSHFKREVQLLQMQQMWDYCGENGGMRSHDMQMWKRVLLQMR